MAHKTASDARRARSKQSSGELQASSDNMQGGQAEHNAADSTPTPTEDQAEITGRFVGVDETDRAVTNFSKIHILKTRSSSEQNLMLKTSSLRKGQYLSSSMLYDGTEGSQNESDKLNNNLIRDTQPISKTVEVNVNVSIGTTTPDHAFNRNEERAKIPEKESLELKDHDGDKDCEDMVKLIKAVSNNSHTYKKNSNVYNLSQAKTVLSERRRSLPMLPKLISQKLNEHNKHFSKSVDSPDLHNGSENNKDFKMKTFRTLSKGLGRLLKRHSSINISEPDPVYKVAYLGNVLTGWAKGEGCVDKPLATLWRNYNQSSKPDVVMKLSITNSGLKGITKEHGLTEYWAHRITYCSSPPEFPKVFCWVYRHEGRKLKHELRCHAVLCSKESVAKKIATDLKFKIKQALFEFKRDKLAKQNARLSLANSVYENPSMPRRKILLSVGGNNYKPPLERSKSAPKLMAIEEMCSEEDEEEMTMTGEKPANTWTKDNSFKMCCQSEDIFPSYTLGRRKCDKKCYRKPVPENRFKTMGTAFRKSEGSMNNAVAVKDNDRVNSEIPTKDSISSLSDESKDTCDESYPYSSQRVSNSTHHVSFSFSTMSESSEINPKNTDVLSDDTEDDVFYCETEEMLSNQDKSQTQKDDDVSINGMDQLCAQTNFLVLDSDEGSISSGCETSSTVTSSDIEMTSLPCNFTINEFKSYPEESEKISVLERVQSFEQLFGRERSNSLQNFRSLNKGNFRYSHAGDFRTSSERSEDSEVAYSSANDSPSYSPSTDSGAVSCGDEVNLVPLGEKHDGLNLRPSYLRCATYPPSDDEANVSSFDSHEFDSRENLGEDVCGASEKGLNFDSTTNNGVEKAEEDSDSACSVESGYSELLDGGQHDCVVGSTVCV